MATTNVFPTTRGRVRVLCALATALALAAPILPPAAIAADCGNTSEGFKALTDLGGGTYQGEQGGLYPGGANKRPSAHTAEGISLAKGQVVPRKANGAVDAKNGKLVFLSVGMSNTEAEFKEFIKRANADSSKSKRVVVVNGAQKGKEAGEVAKAERGYWDEVDARLAAAGVTPAQVGAIWMKETDGSPSLPFKEYIAKLENDFATIVQIAKDRYPNMWVTYVSTRVYGGYAVTDVSPEPWAYQDGFAAKGLIERQLSGQLPIGSNAAPWLSWGPYMWADGTKGRADGLKWFCGDFQEDGVHPSRSGTEKVANLLLNFLHTDATAKIWYTGGSQSPGSGSPGPVTSPGSSATATPGATPGETPGSGSPTATGSPSQPPLGAPPLPDDEFPWAALLLLAAPIVTVVSYRLLRGLPLIPRRRARPPAGPAA
ncbi:MAG: hypothetical protein ACRDKS_00175 [Actinomycetota bacterium]